MKIHVGHALKVSACLFSASVVTLGVAGCANSDGGDSGAVSQSAGRSTEVSAWTGQQPEVIAGERLDPYIKGVVDEASLRAIRELGNCVSVGGTSVTPTMNSAPCDSAGYRVSQIVALPNDCSSDSDQKFFRGEPKQGVAYTACLDFNWRKDKCLSLDNATSVASLTSCESPVGEARSQASLLKPTKVVMGVTNSEQCSSGSGVAHPIRKYAVCFEEL